MSAGSAREYLDRRCMVILSLGALAPTGPGLEMARLFNPDADA
jgi:hypothetical protein